MELRFNKFPLSCRWDSFPFQFLRVFLVARYRARDKKNRFEGEPPIDRNTPVIGGRTVAEYDSLSKKVVQLYTMKEMVLPEDETKIFNEPLETRLEDTNQQLKKWLLRWKPVIDHSMKRVKELAKENSKPIWKHFTAKKPAKTRVSRKLSTGKQVRKTRMSNNPLTNINIRMQKQRPSSRVIKSNNKTIQKD
jgi:hypothetical protein